MTHTTRALIAGNHKCTDATPHQTEGSLVQGTTQPLSLPVAAELVGTICDPCDATNGSGGSAPAAGRSRDAFYDGPDPEIPEPNSMMFRFAQRMRTDFDRLIMEYRFGIDEMLTKINILREEFIQFHRYNPIEHVTSRMKTPQGISEKILRRGISPSLASVREHITDIAGLRITCSFVTDVYRILDMLTAQADVRVLQIKDYIAKPKPNGYKSLHAILETPVNLSTGPVPVVVEVQIRTIAMDFWASLEHKIFYKYNKHVPERLLNDLTNAAEAAGQLDKRMEQIYAELHGDTASQAYGLPDAGAPDVDREMLWQLWQLAQQDGEESHTGPSSTAPADNTEQECEFRHGNDPNH